MLCQKRSNPTASPSGESTQPKACPPKLLQRSASCGASARAIARSVAPARPHAVQNCEAQRRCWQCRRPRLSETQRMEKRGAACRAERYTSLPGAAPLRHVKNPREREPAFQTATSPETPGVCSTRNLQPEQVTTSLYTVAVPYPSRGISPPAKQNALRVRRAWASQEKRTAMKSKTRSSPECAEYENLLKKKERETEEHFCALRAKLLWSFAG